MYQRGVETDSEVPHIPSQRRDILPYRHEILPYRHDIGVQGLQSPQ
jgi:hypothetical protein